MKTKIPVVLLLAVLGERKRVEEEGIKSRMDIRISVGSFNLNSWAYQWVLKCVLYFLMSYIYKYWHPFVFRI